MIKGFSMMKRREDMTVQQFRDWLLKEHVPLAEQVPGMRKYVINFPLDASGDTPFDAVNEMYFDSAEAREQAFASEAGKAAGADAAAHCSARTPLVVSENLIF